MNDIQSGLRGPLIIFDKEKNMSTENTTGPSITELGDPSKPHGEAGAEMLSGMNEHHYEVTGWGLSFLELRKDSRVLDIGCGGGETLRRMSEKVTEGSLTGADHSPLSVKMSLEHNHEAVSAGRLNVFEASVGELPFADDSFDRIITVESFYFWEDPANDLKEVYRVLDERGIFLIVADINGDAELSEEDLANIRKYSLYNPTSAELEVLLTQAGFSSVKIHKKGGTSWICAEGRK